MSSTTSIAPVHTIARQLLDYKAAAERLDMLETTLRTLVCRKKIPHFRLAPRTVRFDPDALDRWLAQRSVEVTGEEKGSQVAEAQATPRRRRRARAPR